MTAESVEQQHGRWPVPPPTGYTVDDLFTLPDLPPHTELIDGSLIFVSPQSYLHLLSIKLLERGLEQTLPSELKVVREMNVVIDKHNAPEPDLSVVRASAITDDRLSRFPVKDVLLAVEVVSPESESRDRTTKPQKYAAAGIPNFWRVEQTGTGRRPVIHVYELDQVTNAYVHMGIHRDQIKVSKPYDIDIDLTAIDVL
ncbi:Uma2 family endonuclease [Streptomyces sp. NPDC093510]|uniref:Uma2 family endonuclease n=1 Tax=Streptomyces sp. NPDC093510 TaxID=3155199 RepID=UPI00342952D6